MDVVRRPATPQDHDVARRLHHEAYRDVVERQFGHWDDAEQDGFFDRVWDRHDHEMLESGGSPCGFVVTDVGSDAIEVRELVVHPDHQGRGIGTAILRTTVDEARRLGLPVLLQVLHENHGASRLYERVGFRVIGATETHRQMRLDPSP